MRTAQEILDTYWDGKLPIDVKGIAHRMGIEVIDNPMLEVSGSIEILPNGKVKIEVDSTQYGPRQKFTIAHEIGHLALGHLGPSNRLLRDQASNFMTGVYVPVEREANKFAAALLMPERMIKFAVSQGYNSLSKLARLFDVSEGAMKWRLINLGLINA